MFSGQLAGIVNTIALERLFAAVSPPIHEIAIRTSFVRGADQHLLMIAPQTDEVAPPIRLSSDQEIHNLLTVRPSIDVVADQDEPGILSTNDLAQGKERQQLVETPVNITNGERE